MKIIELTKGQTAIVCDCHYETVSGEKWRACRCWKKLVYAVRSIMVDGKKKVILMHSVINNTPPGMFTDHINGNPLDNRCCNLRSVTVQQNNLNKGKYSNNTSGFKGVTKTRNKWQAKLKIDGKDKYLGSFDSPEEAAIAHDIGARKYHGEYARTNFEER
jgi:hypothetical protein